MPHYSRVNDVWPEPCPHPTPPEALRGARLLVKLAWRIAKHDIANFNARPRKDQKFSLTSGNRYTAPRSGVWYVNPQGHHFGGWKDIVHDISHWAFRRFWPHERRKNGPHAFRHKSIEHVMAKHVVESGWLTGALKRAEPKAKVRDVKADRAARVLIRLAAWEAKRKRADTAIKKLRQRARYYEKVLAPV